MSKPEYISYKNYFIPRGPKPPAPLTDGKGASAFVDALAGWHENYAAVFTRLRCPLRTARSARSSAEAAASFATSSMILSIPPDAAMRTLRAAPTAHKVPMFGFDGLAPRVSHDFTLTNCEFVKLALARGRISAQLPPTRHPPRLSPY